jgi:lipoate-protein ligase A
VVDGRFADVYLSGDFFLEPDEALEAMRAAVTGVPVDTPAAAIADRVRSALPDGAVLVGVDPDAIAVVLRRGLVRAATWTDYDWQLLDGPAYSEPMQMALDEVLAAEVAAGRRRPTLRFWERSAPAVIIGAFQSVRNEVDLDAAKELGVSVVRRITGGGAMFVEPGSFVTYSIYAPAALVAGMSVVESYAFLDGWVLDGLRSMGIDARHQPINDIASPEGKIGGAAQKRFRSGVVLHHTTMSYDMDAAKMLRVLRIGREKLSDKSVTSAAKRVDPLRRQTGLPREQVIASLQATFRSLYGLTDDHLTPAELAAAERLVATKFATDEWLHRVP